MVAGLTATESPGSGPRPSRRNPPNTRRAPPARPPVTPFFQFCRNPARKTATGLANRLRSVRSTQRPKRRPLAHARLRRILGLDKGSPPFGGKRRAQIRRVLAADRPKPISARSRSPTDATHSGFEAGGPGHYRPPRSYGIAPGRARHRRGRDIDRRIGGSRAGRACAGSCNPIGPHARCQVRSRSQPTTKRAATIQRRPQRRVGTPVMSASMAASDGRRGR